MSPPYTYLPNLAATVEIPQGGILSRTVYSDATVNVVMFGFDAGEELSEHKAARPALLQVISGTATLTLGGDTLEAGPGTWVRMPAGLPHGVRATTPLVLQLTLLPLPIDPPASE
jgi:quercetin dioxygenase-like cupin family protein